MPTFLSGVVRGFVSAIVQEPSERRSSSDSITALEPLQLDHLAIVAAAVHQLGMSTDLGDRSVLQDENAVGVADGTQTVGNDK